MKSMLQSDGSSDKLHQLARYIEAKSQVVNITAIRDYEGIWQKHILDSLEITKVAQLNELLSRGIKVLDLGTGGGFPGLPLAICFPKSEFYLLDATRKKLDVINEFVEISGITNVKTVWGRAEDRTIVSEYGRKFDVVVSRAVAFLPDLMRYSAPYLKSGGYACFYKNRNGDEKRAGDNFARDFRLKFELEYKYDLGGAERAAWIYRAVQ